MDLSAPRAPARTALALAALLAAEGCAFAAPKPGAFYALPASSVPATPGELIRYETMPRAPVGAQAWRVLYSSTGVDGKPVAVSGVVLVPAGPAPTNGWDVVAWAHATTGVAPACAPSLRRDALDEIPGAAPLLSRGYVVTATDYPGLGTAGPHPYLVGESEARAVLDLVRAARKLPAQHVGPRFAVWGHSQGGQAALFTGQLASRYAPELALVGVGAVAPATDLTPLTREDVNTVAGRVFLSYVVWSWTRVYGADPDIFLRPSATAVVDSVAATCVITDREAYLAAVAAAPLRDDFIPVERDSLGVWLRLLTLNTPGAAPVAAPIFFAQGSADDLVPPRMTLAFAARLCRQGEHVRWMWMPGVKHVGAAESAAAAMVGFMEERFSGTPAGDQCGAIVAEAGAK
ncbi:MAG TPA: lipase family protein, partial [Gemmatimonadaceae bacterium]|nr:lipase family protein [Gemmatimonadaceae bacterium]